MNYQEIDGHTIYGDDSTSTTFKCDPPMLFRTQPESESLPGSRRPFYRFEYVTVCSFRKSEEFPYGRTVIHATQRLQGEKGFCYGALADGWVIDGCSNAFNALNSFGYQESEPVADTEKAE